MKFIYYMLRLRSAGYRITLILDSSIEHETMDIDRRRKHISLRANTVVMAAYFLRDACNQVIESRTKITE